MFSSFSSPLDPTPSLSLFKSTAGEIERGSSTVFGDTSRRRLRSPPMGRKFKLSNMMPYAWFYKLRDMGVVHSDQKKHHVSHSSSSTASSSSSSSAIIQLSSSRPNHPLPRKSYHFARQVAEMNGYDDFPLNAKFSDTCLPEPPRKSSKQRRLGRKVARSPPKQVGSSVSAGCSCPPTLESVWSKSESPPGFSSSPFDSSPDGDFRTDTVLATESFHGVVSLTASKPNSCACKTNLNDNDIIIDIDKDSIMIKAHKMNDFNSLPELELAPIITKPATFTDMVRGIKKETKNPRSRKSSAKTEEINSRGSLSVKITKEEKIVAKEQRSIPSRKNSGNSLGVKLRVNSPRIGSRRINAGSGRKSISSSSSTAASSGSNKSLSDSLAIVKSSFDPQRDFRESMVEMIVENNIRASKDLEDLLACYLSLNADEYHDLIIKVFKQIWFDLPNSQIKK